VDWATPAVLDAAKQRNRDNAKRCFMAMPHFNFFSLSCAVKRPVRYNFM
jgi:hypothetical protein